MRVVAGRRMYLPMCRTESHLRSRLKGLAERELRAKLPGGQVSQRNRVPLRDLRRMTRWNQCAESWITGLQRRVTTAMIAVQMGVDEKIKRPLTQHTFKQ